MSQKIVEIGEHIFQVESNFDDSRLNSNFTNYHFLRNNELTPDLFLHITDGFGKPFVNYDVAIKRVSNRIFYNRSDYQIEVDQDYTTAEIRVYDSLALKHALMNLYSSFIVNKGWGLLIHSSCVIENNSAHIFAGHSGAGKSTVAKLSTPRRLLSDEATIVKISKNDIQVYDSPFRSELYTDAEQVNIPLDSIQILHQSPFNKRTSMEKSDSLVQLLDKIFYWAWMSDETKKALDLLKILIEKVPVYNLHFQKNETFWDLI